MKSNEVSVTLGHYGKWPFRFPFRLNEKTLRNHRHVMGVTGQGKSKFLAHFTASNILQGVGCCLIDPHSDLARDTIMILAEKGFFHTPRGYQRLLYVDFSNQERFYPFNFLSQPYPVHEIARHFVKVCTRAWPALADGSAPVFENIMLYSCVVLAQNSLPLTELDNLLTNKDYRERLLAHCSDEKAVGFFHHQFDTWGKDAPALIGSSIRRASLLSFTPALRYTLGQKENKFPFRTLMDQNISVIVNLGGLDEQTQRILGCLLTVGFEEASLSREDIPEEKRTLYHLILDEFSMFSAQSEEALSRVLSLSRKYGLFLTLAHQTGSQLQERLLGALQNAMPMFFRLGYDDALWAAPRLGRANLRHVKHEPKALKGELTVEQNPVYYQLQEEYETWLRKIEDLYPQQCFIKYQRQVPKLFRYFFSTFKTRKIKTYSVPKPKVSYQVFEQMKDYYAKTYGKTKQEIEQEGETQAPPNVPSTAEALPRRNSNKSG